MLKKNKQLISKILNFNFDDDLNDESIQYAQILYLSNDSFNINKLISDYPLFPELVLETIILLFDNPEYSKNNTFPFIAFTSLIDSGNFDAIRLVDQISELRPNFYINILYRLGFKTDESINRHLSNLSVILGFKSCYKILEDKAIWGLSRERVGFFTKNDEKILSMIKNTDCDIFSLEFKLPFFLQSSFSLIFGFDDKDTVTENNLIEFRNILNQLYEMIFPLLSNQNIKNNFCDLITNAYSQDRTKLVFDENNNCTDSFCYSLLTILIRVSRGIFNNSFIKKIDQNKFPTFCFFYIARMMEISIFRLVGNIRESFNVKNSTFLIFNIEEIVQEYLNFVYSLIDLRIDEIYDSSRIDDTNDNLNLNNGINNINNNDSNLNNNGNNNDNININNNKSLASKVSEIIFDQSFLNSILTVQTGLTCKNISKTAITLINIVFSYKNTLKSHCLRIIRTGFEISPILAKRLVIHYLNKNDDHIYEDRVLIHEILQNYELESSKDSLRMIGFALGTFEEKLSSIFDSITKINFYKNKENQLKNIEEECELSEDEENVNLIPREILNRISLLPRPLFFDFIRRMLDDDDLNSEKAKELIKDVEFQIKNKDNPFKMKIFRKIKVNSFRIKRNGDILKFSSFYLEGLLKFLKNSTNINKKLFLNKIIFFRLFSIVNSALDILVGEQSLKIKLQNKEEFKFHPREILRLVLLIILNMLKKNVKLIKACGLNREMLFKAIQIMEDRFVLMEDELADLKSIFKELPEVMIKYEEEDIPEEFVDPLTFNMMENPVILLTSRITIDRSTFDQIMLNDQIDPFSRMPLDESKIKEDVELKSKIEEYKRSK